MGALVPGSAKVISHLDEAFLALAAFQARALTQPSDIPSEPAVNMAETALMATG